MVKKAAAQKDPNKPKRGMSAFFCFCAEERPKVVAIHPDWRVGDVAKELGKRWQNLKSRGKYESQAQEEKKRYEREMAKYKGGKVGKKASGDSSKKRAAASDSDDD